MDKLILDPQWQPQRKIDFPGRKKIQEWYTQRDFGHNALVVHIEELLTAKECENLIEYSCCKGYERAMVNVGGGLQVMDTATRKGDRCIIDSREMSDAIFSRIREELPPEMCPDLYEKKNGKQTAIGLNERLRFLAYHRGGYFVSHFDGSFVYEDRDSDRFNCKTYSHPFDEY